MSLAENRHYVQVKKAKVCRIIKSWHRGWPKDARAIGRYANHGLQICSCFMCGNPRRHHKGAMTMQERRAQCDLNAAREIDATAD